MVPGTGLEPAHLSAPDPKTSVSTKLKKQKWQCGGKGPFWWVWGMSEGFCGGLRSEPLWSFQVRSDSLKGWGGFWGRSWGRVSYRRMYAPLGQMHLEKPAFGLCGGL